MCALPAAGTVELHVLVAPAETGIFHVAIFTAVNRNRVFIVQLFRGAVIWLAIYHLILILIVAFLGVRRRAVVGRCLLSVNALEVFRDI